MVLLTVTPQILKILSSLPPSTLSSLSSTIDKSTTTSTNTETSTTDQDANTEALPLPSTLSSPISHRTLIALARLRSKENGATIPPLNTLLQGTKPYIAPPPPKPQPTAEYKALMARLREEQEQREYAALLARERQQRTSSLISDGMKDEGEDNISPSLVLNILLSVVMCAVAVFQMTKWYANDGVRVLMSLGVGIVVGIAEVGVYSIYLMKVREAKEKEWKKKEKKILIGEYIPPKEEKDGEDDAEVRIVEGKEEIWGRGANGGMRRRVREKWEKEQDLKSKET